MKDKNFHMKIKGFASGKQYVPGYLYSRHNILLASSSMSGRTLILIWSWYRREMNEGEGAAVRLSVMLKTKIIKVPD